jgi:hypothetical protein
MPVWWQVKQPLPKPTLDYTSGVPGVTSPSVPEVAAADTSSATTLLGGLAYGDELTIASGLITVATPWHTVDTEDDAGSDNLAGASGGSEGRLLVISPATDDRYVVVKHNDTIEGIAGTRFFLSGDTDVPLNDLTDCVEFIWRAALDSADGGWQQIVPPDPLAIEIIKTTHYSATVTAFGAAVTGDTQLRFRVNASGTMTWGSGVAGWDTLLSRIDANELGLGAGDTFSAPTMKTDTINEKTADVGVTVDGLLIKDGAHAVIASGDLHSEYQKEVEKGIASGYVPLGSDALVAASYLGTGTADSTRFLRGDGAWTPVAAEGWIDFGTALPNGYSRVIP